ncbi:MAG: hypothetical protein Q7R70_00610 [Candidatus Diapherotrites archaeon]|nr:hypothetical protein [Candidatus Diapherotrites archaeon]
MGNMLAIFKLYAEENEQLDGILQACKDLKVDQVQYKDGRKDPIAFGIECVKVGFMLPDKIPGIFEKLEEELKKIPNTTEVEQAGMTLL